MKESVWDYPRPPRLEPTARRVQISLGDTIGTGTPNHTMTLIQTVAEHVPVPALAGHFHDTYGQALANILACLGISVVDSAVAGHGGCPYAPGATGNVATEEVMYMLDGMEIETGVDLGRLCAAGDAIPAELGKSSGSRVAGARR